MATKVEENSGGPQRAPAMRSEPSEEQRQPHLPWWKNAALPAAALLIYAVLPTKNYYWDGISFALRIEHAGNPNSRFFWLNLIHPNHLFYNLLGYAVWRVIAAIGFHPRALYVLQGINIVAGAACVWVLQRTLLRLTGSAYLSAALSAIFAFSALFWKYATDADAYIGSVFFLVVAFAILSSDRRLRPIPVALAHCAAMMLHQLALLFFPAAALGLFLKGGWRAVWRYVALAAAITLPAYYAGYRLQEGAIRSRTFLQWITNHTPDSSFTFNLLRDLAISASSYVRLFFGGTGHALHYFGPVMMLALILFAIVLTILLARLVRYRNELHLQTDRSQRDAHFWLPPVSAVWLGSYLVFLFFWLPQNTFYKLFCLPAIVFLAAYFLRRYAGPQRNRLALFAAVMALANFALYIYPYSRPDYNQSLRFAVRMRPLWSDRTVVYYRVFTVDNWFICYFNPETTWKAMNENVGASALTEAAAQDATRGYDVWVDTTAAELLAENGPTTHLGNAQEDDYAKHRIRFLHWIK